MECLMKKSFRGLLSYTREKIQSKKPPPSKIVHISDILVQPSLEV